MSSNDSSIRAAWEYITVLPAAMQVFVMLANVSGIISLGPIFQTIIEKWSLWVRQLWTLILPEINPTGMVAPEAVYDMLSVVFFFAGFGAYNFFRLIRGSFGTHISRRTATLALLINVVTVAIVFTNVISNRGGFSSFTEAFIEFATGLTYAIIIVGGTYVTSLAGHHVLKRYTSYVVSFVRFHFFLSFFVFLGALFGILYTEGSFGLAEPFFVGALAFAYILFAAVFFVLALTPVVSSERIFRFATCLTIFVGLAIVSGLIEFGWSALNSSAKL